MSSSHSWQFSDNSRYSTSARLMYMGLSFTIGILTFFAYLFIWYMCSRRRRSSASSSVGRSDTRYQRAADHGMTASAIAALPTFAYENSGGAGAVDCAVCLGQVQGGEKVRRVPKCAHVFHAECIDMWLCSHSTCPICRAAVCPAAEGGKKAESGTTAPAPAPSAVQPLPPV